MSKFAFLFLLFSGSAFAQYNPNWNCQERPGRTICYQMDTAQRAYNWRCNGTACRDVWTNQLYSVQDLVQEIYSYPAPLAVSDDVGNRAWHLANIICGTSRRFGPEDRRLVIELVNEENGLLRELRHIQHQAFLPNIRYCQIRLN